MRAVVGAPEQRYAAQVAVKGFLQAAETQLRLALDQFEPEVKATDPA